ncbi:MAG: hypothetical protein KGL10_05110 [Alphaproteobacteria bacterium]|nr:hypothetical protein [Alphaproteobacteria bacterium]MDE2336671.1 hypothetical protein [Alphaproteobacteria bacterium]
MRRSRPLTSGEIDLARSLFGGAIDYAAVRVHDGGYALIQRRNSGMTPRGEIYTRDCYSADYAREPGDRRAFFLHEMAHVWQYQNKILHPVGEAVKLQLKHRFNYKSAYYFSLDPKKDLTDYGMEQQAAIIEDYYLLRWRLQTGYCTDGTTARERKKQFEAVLAKFLKDPSYAKRKRFRLFGHRFGR